MRELSSAIALEKQTKRELEEQLATLKEAYNALKVTEGELNQQLLEASSLSEADQAAYAEATHERVELEQQIKENETALEVADAYLTVLRNTAMVMFQHKKDAEAKYESAKKLSGAVEAAVNEVLGLTDKDAARALAMYQNNQLKAFSALNILNREAANSLVATLVDLGTAALREQATKDAINAVLTPYAAATTEAETAKNEATQSFNEAGAAIANQVDVVIKGLTDTKVSLTDDVKASDKKLENLRNQAAQSSSAAKNVFKKLEVCKAKQGSKQAEIDPVEEQIAGLTASIATNMDKFNVLSEEVADLQTEYIELYNAEAAARTAAMEAGIVYEDALNHYNGIRYQANNWYSLKAADHSYLMVDTSYLEVEGVDKHLGFKLADHNKNPYDATLNPAGDRYSTVNPRAARDINGRFNFRFYYYPTQDSLVIIADAAARKYESTKTWAERTDAEVWSTANGNIVKLEILGNGRREVTVGSPDSPLEAEWENPTINTRISLGLTSNFSDKVLAAGLYHVTVKNAKNADENGAYLVYDLDGTLTKVKPDAKVDFTHMPATQWAVETATEFGASPAVFNREFYSNTELTGVPYKTLSENEIVATYNYNGKFVQDTLVFNSIADTTLGYYNDKVKINQIYKINNLHVAEGFQINLGSSIMGNDTILSIVGDNAGANFELIPVKYDLSYGLNNFTGVKNLKRGKYSLRVKDTNKLVNNGKYVAVSKVNGTEMLVVTEKAERAAQFFLKEIRCVEGVHYYAMLVVNEKNQPIFKAGVDEAMGLIKAEDIKAETTTSAFTLAITDTDLYRRFNDAELGENADDVPNVLKFYSVNSTAKSYLYEDANSKYSTGKGTNFLGIEGKGDNAKAAMYVDTAYVHRNTLMPQYLLAVGTSIVEGSEELCEVCGKPDCEHSKATRGYTEGRYLVNLTDSVAKYAKTANKDKYTWNEDYTRLAFVQARHMGDSLIIMNTNDTIDLANNAHKAGVFSFRLLKEGSNDFLIESESWGSTHFNGGIAPAVGGWVKIQNGVPVIANLTFEEAALQAEIFNVETTDETPTNNDAIGTVTVSVVAIDGAVIIKGAQGKKVAISNVLGQTIANTVLTSDEATIAVPAGVVVVAVEGEAAVKAIVK